MARRPQLPQLKVASAQNAASVLHVTTGAETVLLAMIAALVAAVIGIVGQLQIAVGIVTVDRHRIAAGIGIMDRLRTEVVIVTNEIAPPPVTGVVIEIADRLPIVAQTATVIVGQPQIEAVTVATIVTGDQPRPATEAETVIAVHLPTGAAIVTEIVVATVTEAQIVEAIAAPQTADGIAATASPHA